MPLLRTITNGSTNTGWYTAWRRQRIAKIVTEPKKNTSESSNSRDSTLENFWIVYQFLFLHPWQSFLFISGPFIKRLTGTPQLSKKRLIQIHSKKRKNSSLIEFLDYSKRDKLIAKLSEDVTGRAYELKKKKNPHFGKSLGRWKIFRTWDFTSSGNYKRLLVKEPKKAAGK